jgi:hypothetical protein
VTIQIPHDVALFLQYMGVPYPDIDEDRVRNLAGRVRKFADNVRDTHDSASAAITGMGSVYSGYSYDQLLAVWASLSATHMRELDTACRVVARALDVAAGVVVAVKVAVLAELAALAAGYAGLMAAAFATGGLTAVMDLAVQTAARKLCEAMEQALVAYLLSEVAGKAIAPLSHAVDRLVRGILDDAAARLMQPLPPGSAPPLSIDLDEVLRYASLLHDYANDIRGHARNFATQTAAGPDIAPAHPPLPTDRPDTTAPARPADVGGHGMSANPAATHPQRNGVSPGDGRTARASGSDGSASTPPRSMHPTSRSFTPRHRSLGTTTVDGSGASPPATPGAAQPYPWTSPVSNSDAAGTPAAVVSQPDTVQAPHAPEQRDTPTRPGGHPDPTAPGQAPITAGSGGDAPARTPAPVAGSTDHPGTTGPDNRSGPLIPPAYGTPQDAPASPSPWARSRRAVRKTTSAKNTLAEASPPPLPGDTPAKKAARTPWSTPKPAPAAARVFPPRTRTRPTATPPLPGDATVSRPASRTPTTKQANPDTTQHRPRTRHARTPPPEGTPAERSPENKPDVSSDDQ